MKGIAPEDLDHHIDRGDLDHHIDRGDLDLPIDRGDLDPEVQCHLADVGLGNSGVKTDEDVFRGVGFAIQIMIVEISQMNEIVPEDRDLHTDLGFPTDQW